MKQKFFIILSLFIIGLISCEETNEIVLPESITVTPGETLSEALTKAGWAEFEKANYTGAAEYFLSAIAKDSYCTDAYNGLGWSHARLDSLTAARNSFTIAQGSSDYRELIYRDASAGRAFVNLALDQYDDAIADVNYALQIQYYPYYSDYVFRHDMNITELDLLLVKAESFFLTENYNNCYQALLQIDDTLIIDFNNPEELAATIEYLKRII